MKNIFLKGWRKYILGYILLLIASHLVIWAFEEPIEDDYTAEKSERLQVVQENLDTSEEYIEVDYQDIYSGNESNPPVMLLLPGGLEGPEVFEEISDSLSTHFRLIIPHLPGYGNREKDLPNYSFQALSVYTNQLLEKLQLSDIHVLGYGLGGASAIYLAEDYPEKVQSLSLVSSIGVQELELLGSYRLNHAVHGIQLATFWVLDNAVPHFGLLNMVGINVSYAKSHYESDQRPLRGYLKEFKKPMLILHGSEDPLVPVAAAEEHHRIVPQSELKLFNSDHDLISTHSDSVKKSLVRFISDVESGKAKTASDATSERTKKAQESFSNVDFQKFEGVSLLIIMLIIILSTLISEDLTCIGAGLLAARGLIGFWPASAACLIGIIIGNVGLYLVGRFMGRPAVRKAPFKWIFSERDLDRSAKWFNARGPTIIIASRFLPGSRLPTYFSAGVIGAGFWMFLGYFLLSTIVYIPLLVGLSMILGNELIRFFTMYQDYAIWAFAGALFFLVMLIKFIIPVFSYRGRRMIVSRYRRITRWQYWSPLIRYITIGIYIFYLGLKYRCLTLFTATNPAISDGGFVSTSKTEMLELFDVQHVARYMRIEFNADTQQMLDRAAQFIDEHGISYPIVLKPDVSEWESSTQLIQTADAMETYLENAQTDVIIQEYVDGEYFGIFYYQYPDKERGSIFSVTTQESLTVEGNGKKTVEELILEDDRAVNLAKYHLRENEGRLYTIPDRGEQLSIVGIGTQTRETVFGDGKDLITEELTEKMNAISPLGSGFYFGRFDIKAPSKGHLKEGKKLKIVGVKGVTAESTNIYDRKYSFWDAQKILMKQWKLAFEIAEMNRKQGTEVIPVFTFLKRMGKALAKS